MKTSWAVLLCKFKDSTSEPPFAREFYQELFTAAGSGSQNMVDYFRDVSHGNVDLRGSQVFGWFTIDKSRSEYTGSGLNPKGRQQLVDWAKQAAVDAPEGIKKEDLDKFYGIVVCMDVPTEFFGGGGIQAVCDKDSMQPSLLGQEMGHGYDLEHSRVDGSEADYKDRWDVMSTMAAYMAPHPKFGLVGPGLNACNMRGRGWLDESRVWKGGASDSIATVELRPLHRRDLPGLLAAEVGDGYLVEFRMSNGWDAAIPRPAVLIHRLSGNHSYIMRGTKGQQDLVEGDVFEIGTSKVPLSPYSKVQVVSIDPKTETATLYLEDRPGEKPPIYVPWPLYVVRRRFLDEFVVDTGGETVVGGGLVDGGGWIVVGGKIVRVQPWDPTRRLIEQIALFQASELATQPWSRDVIRREALSAISAQVAQMTADLNPFRVPALPSQADEWT